MGEANGARFANLLKQSNENDDTLDHSVNVGKYITTVRKLRKKYRENEITLLDIYEYYRIPLSVYTSKKIRNIFITASLCLTVYLTSNIALLRSNRMPALGMNFSSTTLVAGSVFVLKEILVYVINLKKMISIFYIYQYILGSNAEKVKFRKIIKGIIKLEKKVHRRKLTQEDVKNIINHERFLLFLMIRKFPTIFNPVCSNFLLYILRLYIDKIREGPLGELRDEIRVVSIAIFVLSPVISIFFILYYVARIIEKSQSNAFYAFRKMYRPTFRYFMSKKTEYPHETQRKMQRSARYLNDYFLIRKKDYVVGICSALSFFLSCLIFFIIYLIFNTILTNKPDIGGILYQNIKLFGRTTNIVYLFYAIGGISCCLRCLNFNYTNVNRRKTFAKWCGLMEQEMLLKYSRNRRYLSTLMSRFFVPRLQLFAIEIISPFFVPFQLSRLRKELENIHTTFNSATADQEGYHSMELEEYNASILDL